SAIAAPSSRNGTSAGGSGCKRQHVSRHGIHSAITPGATTKKASEPAMEAIRRAVGGGVGPVSDMAARNDDAAVRFRETRRPDPEVRLQGRRASARVDCRFILPPRMVQASLNLP